MVAFPISAVQVNTHNISEALAFYCELLGFEPENRDGFPNVVTLKNEGFFLILHSVPKPSKNSYPDNAQVVVNLRVDELEELATFLTDAGVKILHTSPQACPVGHFIAIEDPSGNVLELVQFR